MSRAKRHYLPGYIWHITHRCHKGEFLLKFHRDRKKWLYWLYQANQRFRVSILNYIVTSNHIHLLVFCDCDKNDIANAIHLASGRTAWEYNKRKKRRGSFWEDRYHATAVAADNHLLNCMVYIDMNMIRAGVVKHPRQWPYCGYQEISGNRQRYTIIDKEKWANFFGEDIRAFKHTYDIWIEEYLNSKKYQRESRWTESIAVGEEDFIEKIQSKLGEKAKGRKILKSKDKDSYELREAGSPYS